VRSKLLVIKDLALQHCETKKDGEFEVVRKRWVCVAVCLAQSLLVCLFTKVWNRVQWQTAEFATLGFTHISHTVSNMFLTSWARDQVFETPNIQDPSTSM
jgi:hypothetical protein